MLAAPLLIASAVLCPAARAGAQTARFTVTDQLAQQEVSETTEFYLDGRLLGQLHLDDKTRERVIDVTVADPADRHQYALCGEITVRRTDGRTETHEVNSVGLISDVGGRDFQALGASDFTFFYLMDETPGRALPMPLHGRSALCHPPVS